MIPHIPNQRQHAGGARKPFNDLVAYIEENQEQELQPSPDIDPQFSNLLEYATSPVDKLTNGEKCLAIRTHGVTDIRTAAIEMNAVATQNRRCPDPAYHFLLSWPEHETPDAAAVFDAAEHAIRALGLADHQYVLAIHGNTDNRHCHIAVNRIHPVTYKAQHIEWAKKTLHFAARESEIKHGWTHDNGLYIVQEDRNGNKTIAENPDLGAGNLTPHAHREDREPTLPTWHDPDSLETWLKTTVSRPLKRALPKLQNWHALHAILDKHSIVLTDTGGGGMRLKITSQDTGEILDIPASKGLRFLKRADLEKRWGPFAGSIETKCVVPDTSNLTNQQLIQGANRVLERIHDPRTPADNLLHTPANRARIAANRSSGLHELPVRGMDDGRQNSEVLLPNALHVHMGDTSPRQDQDMRRPSTGPGSSRELAAQSNPRHRNDAQREQRKAERAADRANLRQRFTQYKSFVRQNDPEHTAALKALQTDRRTALAAVAKESKEAKRTARKQPNRDLSTTLLTIVAIDAETVRRKLQIEKRYQQKATEHRATRQPPLGWREWLHEQSNLGDQAAISALRGIVYQAQRDAKKADPAGFDDLDEERAARDAEYREEQHRKVLARLLEEEKNEISIRAARSTQQRPHELDALLIRYAGIQWRVTGNGNIEYSDRDSAHLFTDRGNRLTFDRVRVGDQEIKLALLHAQQKFGKQITLTGDDPIFTARMARLADDMGLTVLNPALQTVIAEHRTQRQQPQPQSRQPATTTQHAPIQPAQPQKPQKPREPAERIAVSPKEESQDLPTVLPAPTQELSLDASLRAKVLAIDPRATFIQPDLSDSKRIYSGPVAATHQNTADAIAEGFAQHIGRSQYILHSAAIPQHTPDTNLDIRYQNQQPQITATKGKSKGRDE